MLTTRGESTARGIPWGDSSARSDPEEVARPARQEIDEQHQQGRDESAADDQEPPVHSGHLLLSGDGALLELERALGHAPILGQVHAPSTAPLPQAPAEAVTLHPPIPAPAPPASPPLA